MHRLFLFVFALILISCSSPVVNDEFIEKTEGRYLFNSDQVIEVYYQNKELFLKWSGANNIKPMQLDENTFFVKEMSEKIQFLVHPEDNIMYLSLVPKDGFEVTYNYRKLDDNEFVPGEYFKQKEFDKARLGFIAIKEKDSLDPIIEEARINRWGYNELRENRIENAVEIFKINTALYPNSSNVYDSLGEALLRNGDTIAAIDNYKKSLAIDTGNRRAKELIERLEK